MGLITFNGKSTEELGLISQAVPAYEFPKKNYKYTHIPGRNGDLVTDLKSYENIERTYYLACVYKPGTNFALNSGAIVDWLMNAKGYCRLEDSYEPDVYRLATYVNNGSLADIYGQATTLNVTFNCKPQRYLKDGEKEKSFNTSGGLTLINPTGYESLPLIKFKPTASEGTITISINGEEIGSVALESSVQNKTIYIDSEIQYCYYIENNIKKPINRIFTMSTFPILKSGISTITFSSGSSILFENVTIIPRWWKL